MQLLINGEPRKVAAGTLAELVAELGLTGRRIAIEHNGEIAPRSAHATTPVQAGDRIEIVHAIGGG
ncbi:MAG: sulfur carrier protein ThiS [Moraxellaceae bacterium]